MPKRRKRKQPEEVRESTPAWERLPRLTGLVVQGFQSVRDRTEIEVRPLTLIAGRNSSGKSSLVRPLLLLKQTIDAPFDPGPLLFNGPNVALESLVECAWRPNGSGDPPRIAVGLAFDPLTAEIEFADYVGSLLLAWQDAQDERHTAVTADMRHLDAATSVRALRRGSGIEVRVGRRTANGRRTRPDDDLADVGSGVRHALTVVTALRAAQRHQVVYVEDPESHLHPAAQVAMARVLLDAARRGVTVIAETHSDLVLRSVLTEVAKGEFAPDLVKLHWVELGKDGATEVRSADVDEKGRHPGWKGDFEDVDTRLDDAYLHASLWN